MITLGIRIQQYFFYAKFLALILIIVVGMKELSIKGIIRNSIETVTAGMT